MSQTLFTKNSNTEFRFVKGNKKVNFIQPESNDWILKIETPSFGTFNKSFIINISGNDPIINVDWGDGTVETFTTAGEKQHTYAINGIYKIELNGSFTSNGRIWFGDPNPISSPINIRAKIISTSVIPQINGLESVEACFGNCQLSFIPSDLFSKNPSITNFNSCFVNCNFSSIPPNLFANNTAATSFNNCFLGCTSLISIPAALFANNTGVTSFERCFYNCTLLTSISSTLFANNTAVTNFRECFYACILLTFIPENLFANNTAVTSFESCFNSCQSLTSIPANLFANNTAVTSFESCFNNCTSLTSVPATLFANNIAVTNFHACFLKVTLTTTSYSNLLINMASNAASRQNNVPFGGGYSEYNLAGQTARNTLIGKSWTFTDGGLEGSNQTWDVGIQTTEPNQTFSIQLDGSSPNIIIDWGNGSVETFVTTGIKTRIYTMAGYYTIKIRGSFSSNGNIKLGTVAVESARVLSTSIIPTIPGLTSFAECFKNCTSLIFIPANLFANNTAVTSFESCFHNCPSLTSIPANLFANNTAVTSFEDCFGGCGSLNSIPTGLFANNTAATNFVNCFFACTSLAFVPSTLFANNTAVTTFFGCFSFCQSLISVPSTLFANNTAVTNFHACFYNCTSLTSVPSTLFANNTAVTTFLECFSNCTSLTSVPSTLFANNTAVTTFAICFLDCTSLTSVPSTLFANNTAVTSFESCFFNVTLTTQSYSNLLINMASNAASRQNNVPFGGGYSEYNLAGQTARNTLIGKSWTFNDGGLDTNNYLFKQKLIGDSAGDEFGVSVATNSGGTVLMMGGYKDDDGGTNAGAALVYTGNAMAGWQLRQKLTGDSAGDSFGWSVTTNAAGTVLIMGEYGDDDGGTDAGAALIYTGNSTAGWQLRQKLTGDSANDLFGYSVAANSDGTVLIIGGQQDDDGGANAGAALIYTGNATAGWQLRQKLTGDSASDFFGTCVATNSDGTVLMMGGPGDDDGGTSAGAALVYTGNATAGWQLRQKLTGDSAFDSFGMSVATNSNGTVLMMGGIYDDNAGAALVYTGNAIAGWGLRQKLTGDSAGDFFGTSVATNSDGTVLIMGGPVDGDGGNNAGAALIYTGNATAGWQLRQKLTGDSTGDFFGWSVATNTDGTVLMMGGYGDDDGGTNAGAALVYILLQTWDVGIQTTASNQTFGIVLNGTSPNITVDWGDGTSQILTTNGNHQKIYSSAGNYIVKISGSFAANGNIRLGTNDPERARVKTTSVIPKIPGLTSFFETFRSSALTQIPAGLFSKNVEVTSFDNCFLGCSLLTSIPSALFANNTTVTSFVNCFRSCALLNSIPSELFANNTAVTNFESCFENTPLTSIPSYLFANNTAVTSFSSCFQSCQSLTTIPSTLFNTNTVVTTFDRCFVNCSSLTSIPATLFANNTAVTDFSNCFGSCLSLTSIPATLFANNTAVTSFAHCFSNVTLTITSYSNLLINMAFNASSRLNNVFFGGGNSKYNLAGQTARQTLEAKGWTFNDGGLDTN